MLTSKARRATDDPTGDFLRHPPDFSLVIGGPLYQLLRRTHLSDDVMGHVQRRLVLIALFCWLPLFILSALQGHVFKGSLAIPFLYDFEVHVRFLLVVPLLIAAEPVVHSRMRQLLELFLARKLFAARDLPRFESAVKSAVRLRNSITAEVVLVALVYYVGVVLIWRNYTALDTESWYYTRGVEGWHLTRAGQWYAYVSLPIFQFLLLRWYFRILVWTRFLWQVSRIELQLQPAHPDRLGGLGFLSGVVYAFVPLLMAHGALLAGFIANRIFYRGETLTDFKYEIAILVVFLICIVQGPLLMFTPQLEQAKRLGKNEYGNLAQTYTRDFDQKWLRGGAANGEALLGSADIQSLADLGNAYQNVQSMSFLLVSRDSVLTFIGAIIAPIVPLILTMIPLEEVLKQLFGVLF